MQAAGVGLIQPAGAAVHIFHPESYTGRCGLPDDFLEINRQGFHVAGYWSKNFYLRFKKVSHKNRETANVQNRRWRFIPIF
jgi:hypothetical protein